jgi:hypothetical protein
MADNPDRTVVVVVGRFMIMLSIFWMSCEIERLGSVEPKFHARYLHNIPVENSSGLIDPFEVENGLYLLWMPQMPAPRCRLVCQEPLVRRQPTGTAGTHRCRALSDRSGASGG